jgi:hypothetical protein
MALKIRAIHIIIVVAVMVLIVGGLLLIRCNCQRPGSALQREGWFEPSEKVVWGPSLPWESSEVKEAKKILKEWPGETILVEVPPAEETTYLTVQGSDIEISSTNPNIVTYREPNIIGIEVRPFVGGGYGTGAMFVGGIDLLKVGGRVHLGPCALYDGSLGGGGAATYNVWRNIDVGVAGGYGNYPMAAGVVTFNIQ